MYTAHLLLLSMYSHTYMHTYMLTVLAIATVQSKGGKKGGKRKAGGGTKANGKATGQEGSPSKRTKTSSDDGDDSEVLQIIIIHYDYCGIHNTALKLLLLLHVLSSSCDTVAVVDVPHHAVCISFQH
jgi:hypothetical protein